MATLLWCVNRGCLRHSAARCAKPMRLLWTLDGTLAIVNGLLDWVYHLDPAWFAVLALAENVALVGVGWALGVCALRLPGGHRLTADPGPVSRLELTLVVVTTVLNTGVTIAGWWLWRAGLITLTTAP